MKHTICLLIIALGLLSFASIGCGGGSNNLSKLSVQELYDLGKMNYDKGKYIKAINHFQTIVYNFPGASVVDTAQYYLALSYFSDKEFELAQVEFNRLAVNYPASVYFENAIFMKAVCFYESTPKHYGLDQSALNTAIVQFEDFIIDFPESDVVPDCQAYLLKARTRLAHKFYNSAKTYTQMGTFKAAEIYYQKVVDEYTSTEYAPLATYGLATVKYKMKEYELAKEKFQDFTVVFREHALAPKAAEYAEKSAYLSGEKAFEKNDFIKAKEFFELFKTEFPSSKKIKDVDKYLEKISNNIPIEQNENEQNS